MAVTMRDIPTIRDDLKKRKLADLANNSDKPLSNREVVKQLAPTLLKMKERGFSIAALAELLQEHQVTIKSRDLIRYLREYQAATTRSHGMQRRQETIAPPEV